LKKEKKGKKKRSIESSRFYSVLHLENLRFFMNMMAEFEEETSLKLRAGITIGHHHHQETILI